MTEPTIAEVLAKYPDCKVFVDSRDVCWIKEGVFLESKEGFNSIQIEIPSCFTDKMAIPGLRPRFHTRKVTIEGFLRKNKYGEFDFTRHVQACSVPATLTYEIDEVQDD